MEARRLRTVVDRVGKRMQNREGCAALGSWLHIMQEHREREVKLARALRKLKNKQINGAFNTWLEQVLQPSTIKTH